MRSKYKRVGLVGASGTGKTTLASYISTEFQLPYLNSSSSKLWDGYGYKNHRDVQWASWADPDNALRLQEEILTVRDSMFACKNWFVTDRTPIDQLAYYLNYFQLISPITKIAFVNRLKAQGNRFDAIIFLRFTNELIEDNGRRIIDPFYQIMVDALMNSIIERNILGMKVPVLTLDMWDWNTRRDEVIKFLRG